MKIIDKFDKRSVVRKIFPLVLLQMKHEKLSLIILPTLINFIKVEGNVTKEDFTEHIWWAIKGLCQMKSLPAQCLLLLI